jgi:hypothetical protein
VFDADRVAPVSKVDGALPSRCRRCRTQLGKKFSGSLPTGKEVDCGVRKVQSGGVRRDEDSVRYRRTATSVVAADACPAEKYWRTARTLRSVCVAIRGICSGIG